MCIRSDIRRIFRAIAFCLTAVILCFTASSALAYDESDFLEFAQKQYRTGRVKSGLVLVSLNGERVATFAYGPRTELGGEITADTAFRVASVTKFVTAIGLMTLYDQGKFELDADIRETLPMMPLVNPAYPDVPITARQLLSHTSSFKGDANYTTPTWELIKNPNNDYYERKFAPGTHYQYSNMNGAMFGSMIEALSGKSLNTYVRESVFDPLGINAAYHPYLLPDQSNVADTFGLKGMQVLYMAEVRRFENYHDTCDPRANCGYSVGRMYISGSGLERLLITLMNGGSYGDVQLLRPETVAMMEAEQETVPGSSVSCASRYGLGMEHLHGMPGGIWYGHQGRVGGLTCDAYYQKDTGLTLVVITTGYKYGVKDSMVTLALRFMTEVEKFVSED